MAAPSQATLAAAVGPQILTPARLIRSLPVEVAAEAVVLAAMEATPPMDTDNRVRMGAALLPGVLAVVLAMAVQRVRTTHRGIAVLLPLEIMATGGRGGLAVVTTNLLVFRLRLLD
ncbi:MAG: hypothetical protein ACU837_14475 [Gammaproteobacteria bacterium]